MTTTASDWSPRAPGWARDQPILAVLFRTSGVAEVILGEGVALVRLGRLFRWEGREEEVQAALASFTT